MLTWAPKLLYGICSTYIGLKNCVSDFSFVVPLCFNEFLNLKKAVFNFFLSSKIHMIVGNITNNSFWVSTKKVKAYFFFKLPNGNHVSQLFFVAYIVIVLTRFLLAAL